MNNKMVLFGGSFDPPHFGHLLIAQWVAEVLASPVHFLPNGSPPHKSPYSSKKHRTMMLNLATEDNPNFRIDDSELQCDTVNYTVDTLNRYHGENNLTRDNLFFVLGSDAINSLESWREPGTIAKLCTLVVYKREPVSPQVIDRLNRQGARIIISDAPILEISSSMIRKRVSQGKSIRYFVPEKVRDYILKWELYKEGKNLTVVEGK